MSADEFENVQRDALVKVPPLDGNCDEETSQEQEYEPTHVFLGDVVGLHQTQKREQGNRQKGRGGNGDSLGDPPGGHQHGNGGHGSYLGILGVEIEKEVDESEQDGP